MLIVSGIITMDPSGVDRATALVAPLVQATLAEPGNITYGFWSSLDEPGVFRVYEEWQDDDAIDAHMVSEHMGAFLVGMAELPITGTEIIKHTVSESSKLM